MLTDLPGTLTELERSALSLLIDRPGELFTSVRAQLAHASVSDRESTGVGFFTNFIVPPDAPVSRNLPDSHISGVYAEHPDVPCGVSFILFLRSGSVAWLEGVTFDGPWPSDDSLFQLYRDDHERNA